MHSVVGPPESEAKREHLLDLFSTRGHSVLVETGTYLGDTVAYFLSHATRIVSIEIEPTLYAAACRRFAKEPSVELIEGDALAVVPQLLQMLDEPPLLWLDGHFSGGVTGKGQEIEPAGSILERLSRIKKPSGMTVVIDDLRLFGREPDFPTLDVLIANARAAFPLARIHTGLDSLVIEA